MSQGVCSHSTISAQTEMAMVLYQGALAGAAIAQTLFPNYKFFAGKWDGDYRCAIMSTIDSGIVSRGLELGYPVLRLKPANARGNRRVFLQVDMNTEQDLHLLLSESKLPPVTDYLRSIDGSDTTWVFTKHRGRKPQKLTNLTAYQRAYGVLRQSADA